MVLKSPEHVSHSSSGSPKRLTLGLLMSVSSLIAVLVKRASRVSAGKFKTASKPIPRQHFQEVDGGKSPRFPPKSPLVRPKQLFTQVSNKAIMLIHPKKRVGEEKDDVFLGPKEFGDGGVWQRAILMGDKCQPLDFSGVIYYDSHGKQLDEVPMRSPRASPLPGYLARQT